METVVQLLAETLMILYSEEKTKAEGEMSPNGKMIGEMWSTHVVCSSARTGVETLTVSFNVCQQ